MDYGFETFETIDENKLSELSKSELFKNIYKTLLSYCLKCRKNSESENPSIARKNK